LGCLFGAGLGEGVALVAATGGLGAPAPKFGMSQNGAYQIGYPVRLCVSAESGCEETSLSQSINKGT